MGKITPKYEKNRYFAEFSLHILVAVWGRQYHLLPFAPVSIVATPVLQEWSDKNSYSSVTTKVLYEIFSDYSLYEKLLLS